MAAVVAYHLGFGWARGGYLGVDTFLVLSGYLITFRLLGEHARCGTIRLGAFWERRLRRLLPALVIVLVAAAVFAATTALPDEAHSLRLDAVSAIGFVSNWRFIATSQGYFGQTAAPSLLRHTWSLAVEGQLYLVWPLVVAAVLGRRGLRALAVVALGLAAASAGLAIALASTAGGITRAYYGTDTRAAAFLLGAAVAAAIAVRPRSGRPVVIAGAAGAVCTAVLWATLSGTSPWLFRGGLAVSVLAAAAVVVGVVGHPAGAAGRMLAVAPLRLLGRVSYGVYLWHWPLLLVLSHRRTGLTGAALLFVRLAAIGAATAASWLLVERPVARSGPWAVPRSGPWAVPRRWHPALAVTACVAIAGATLVPLATRAGPGRPEDGTTAARMAAGGMAAARTAAGETAAARMAAGGTARMAAGGAAGAAIPVDVQRPLVPAVMLGDSVALTLGTGLEPLGPAYHVRMVADGIVGCGVAVGNALRSIGQVSSIPGRCLTWEQQWASDIAATRAVVAVVLLGRWEILDRQVAGRWQHIGQPEFDTYLAGQLDLAITIAQRSGVAVILCTTPYFRGIERPGGGTWPENDPVRVERFNGLVRDAAARHAGTVLFDLNALVSPGNRFASVVGGVPVRSSDGVHFATGGAAFVSAVLLPLVAGLGRQVTALAGSGAAAD